MSKIQNLSIDLLRLDGDTQARIAISADTVDDYADLALSEGEWPFDPIDVFHDGSEYYVSDGFHRTLAAVRLKRASISCRVHNGTAKDARIFGMTANDTHGLRMSQADKRACVIWLLDNGGEMTQAEIAAKAGVSLRMVSSTVAERKPANAQIAHSETSESPVPSPPITEPTPKKAADAKAKAAAAKAKAEAAAAKKKEKSDAAAAKAKAKAVKDKEKADAKAAKEKARSEKEAAKAALLTTDGQIKNIKNLIQQHIGKTVRLLADLHRVKPNRAAMNSSVKACEGIKTW